MAIKNKENGCYTMGRLAKELNEENALRAVHTIARSMKNKVEDLSIYFESTAVKFDINCITETWMTVHHQTPFFPGYHSEHLVRNKKKGGGVAIYVKDTLSYSVAEEVSEITEDVECLMLLIGKTTASVIYRPPNGRKISFNNFLERLLQQYHH